MNIVQTIQRLEGFPAALVGVVRLLDDDDRRFKPEANVWSIHEIIAHLADEEVDDFRARVAYTLAGAQGDFPRIDPEGWVEARGYDGLVFDAVIERFLRERRASVEWLRSLDQPNWNAVWHHPSAGPLRAGDLLASWAMHDAVHLRQIARRLVELTAAHATPYSTTYAL